MFDFLLNSDLGMLQNLKLKEMVLAFLNEMNHDLPDDAVEAILDKVLNMGSSFLIFTSSL